MSKSLLNGQNVKHQKKLNELPHHWHIRREFLLAHCDKIPLERLICLSQAFVNVECLGSKYPEELMKTIKELGSTVDLSVLTKPLYYEQAKPEARKQQQQQQRCSQRQPPSNQSARRSLQRRTRPNNSRDKDKPTRQRR